jgi:hypothetical protein
MTTISSTLAVGAERCAWMARALTIRTEKFCKTVDSVISLFVCMYKLDQAGIRREAESNPGSCVFVFAFLLIADPGIGAQKLLSQRASKSIWMKMKTCRVRSACCVLR